MKMSEVRTSGFFRPWHIPETTNEVTAVTNVESIIESYNRIDDDESLVSSVSSTTSATTSTTLTISENGHVLHHETVELMSSSIVDRERERRGNESDSDDNATSITPSLEGEEILGMQDTTKSTSAFRSKQPDDNCSMAPTSHIISAQDSDDFNVSNYVYPLKYMAALKYPRSEDFVIDGGAYSNLNISGPSPAVNSTVSKFLYSLPGSHFAIQCAVHPGLHREVQPEIYPGIFLSTYNNHFMEEAVQLVHRQDAAAKQIKKMRPKKFRCQHCDMAFSNNGQLKGHIRIHTGERPFKCDVESCGKSFTRNEELTRHKRIHTGVRPHSCVVCGKRFGRKDHLKKHTRTHEIRDPYRVSAAALGMFSLGHPFQQAAELPPYVYQI